MTSTQAFTAIAIIFMGGSICHSAPVYSLTNLGAESVSAINNAGQILGSDSRGSFLLSDGAKEYLPQPAGGTFTGRALNNAGQVAGYVNYQNQSNYVLAIAQNGVLNITGLGGLAPGAINDTGQIVGAQVFTYQGFFYSGGNVTTLGPLPYALNDAGTAVGTTLEILRRAFMYQNGQVTYLMPPGAASASAYAVNNSGVIAGSFSTGPLSGLQQPFIYANGTYIEPGFAFNTAPESDGVNALNSAGVIVGTAELSGPPSAWVYDPLYGYLNLNSEVNAPGWRLQTAVDINDSGQIIGTGVFNGQTNAFLLTPVPEPSEWALLLIGVAGLGLNFRRATCSTRTRQRP